MKNIILLFSTLVLSCTACKKEGSKQTVKTKKEILTNGKWQVVSSKALVQVPNSPTQHDLFATLPTCQKDNLYVFNSEGTGTIDEGSSKCNPDDPQSTNTGNWQLFDNDKKLRMTVKFDMLDAEIVSDILELNDMSMVLKYDTTYLSYPTTITTTFSHIRQ